ncbi:MAG: cyclic nucleotide-binding domain-containing protein [Hyphomicrobiales bacterium]|nr:MAG: cyclic nucleotide-binding domain-containing protein [Hyphomicrobiales bacterium]
MQKITFEAGDTILTEGEDGDTAFLIVSGKVEVVVGSGAKSKTVATLRGGDVFGEMSLLEPGPRSATVKALDRTVCTVTSYADFMSAIQDDPAQAVLFMRTLVTRLRQTNDMLAKLDPRKRGIRELLADMQKNVALDGAALGKPDWYDWNSV